LCRQTNQPQGLAAVSEDWKIHTLCSSGGGQQLCFAEGKVESRSPQGEKHEKDDCQDHLGYVLTARLGYDTGHGRYRTSAHVLPTALSRAIGSRQEFH